MSCAGVNEWRQGNATGVYDRLTSAEDGSLIDDATMTASFVDDNQAGQTIPMDWDALHERNGLTGWYVGVIPATAVVTRYQSYEITYKGTGGSLVDTYSDRIVQTVT